MMHVTLPRRSGVTLSEILISMLVMSIGIVSLATLFPISILRSIQATQLTNATIHRLNAEELISLFPRLVHDPDGDANFIEHESSGADRGRFIVDPLGFNNPLLIGPPDVHSFFGNNGGVALTPPATSIRRYDGSTSAISNITAANLGYSPDTWQLFAQGFLLTSPAPTGTQISISANTLDYNSLISTLNGGVQVRVILFSQSGRQSTTRTLALGDIGFQDLDSDSNYDAGEPVQLNWTAVLPDMSNQYFIDANTNGQYDTGETVVVSRFRLETSDPRYSWLLTVRKTTNAIYPAGDAHIDVVLFHKRAFSVASEQVFFANDRTPAPVPAPPPNIRVAASPGDTSITLDLTDTNALTPAIKPFLKRGSFVFDIQNAYWYRVVQFTEDAVNPVITVDRPIVFQINSQVDGTRVPTIMAMPGIVEVYPLGTISYDPNNPP